jgi:hypothetical protein
LLAFSAFSLRTHFALVLTMLAYLLGGFAAWLVASTALGIVVGKIIAAHERTPWVPDARQRSTRRAA